MKSGEDVVRLCPFAYAIEALHDGFWTRVEDVPDLAMQLEFQMRKASAVRILCLRREALGTEPGAEG